MIRVAFTMIDGSKWKGGYNYLLNLLRVLSLYQNNSITPVLFMGEDCAKTEIDPFRLIPGVEFVRTSLLDETRRVRSLLQALLIGRDISLKKLFGAFRIDVVFEAAQFFGWRLGVPAIAWIPDFQHLALPAMFSFRARWKREFGFRAQVLGRRIIMLSSEHARLICEAKYPRTRGYTRTIHFAVPFGSSVTFKEARKIADDYGLPECFFYMPNQFWMHKNHLRVIEALGILRQRGIPTVVAASGKQADYRNPDYFNSLQVMAKQLGVENDFYVLGLIPYHHVIALMRASVALLNPSLSEGWSTSVEEARALGTPMVLSDLAVHKEQMGNLATYFDRYSPQSLANVLEYFQPLSEGQRKVQADAASRASEQGIRRFSDNFTNLIKGCVN